MVFICLFSASSRHLIQEYEFYFRDENVSYICLLGVFICRSAHGIDYYARTIHIRILQSFMSHSGVQLAQSGNEISKLEWSENLRVTLWKFCELIDQFRGLGVKNIGSRSWVLNKTLFMQHANVNFGFV